MTPAELTNARKALHLSQRDLAKVLGVHPNIVNRWEHGRAKIPPYMQHTMSGVERWLLVAVVALDELDRRTTTACPAS